jgi:hypothetical protein
MNYVSDSIDAGNGMISLAVGFFDVITGAIMAPRARPATTVGLRIQGIIRELMRFKDTSEPCKINWDVETITRDGIYFISSLTFAAETLDDRDGTSLVTRIDMSFTTHGRRVETNA